jgi:hypothetical protein
LFQVRYVSSEVWRSLTRMGWNKKRLQRLAIQRDEEAIENWQVHELARIKKRRELNAWLVLEDERGFHWFLHFEAVGRLVDGHLVPTPV